MEKLSVVIITNQEEENIARCLDSVKGLAGEIVVVDSHSRDRTVEIAKSYGCNVYIRDFDGYGRQKQFAVDQATNHWVLSLDADEVVSDELRDEITALLQAGDPPFAGFRIPFAFFYLGRILKFTRADHLRLFDRRKGKFTDVPVHEGIDVDGPVGKLQGKVIHYSYRDIAHHLQKINIYTTQAALKNRKEGKSYSRFWVVLKFPVSFFIYYVLRLGFLDGYPGFLWAFFAAFYSSLKIAKTIEMQTKRQ